MILDRRIEFDEKSRDYPIRTLIQKPPRSYTWKCSQTLDQGEEGACVGFAWTHELISRPKPKPKTTEDAFAIYKQAQKEDSWPGEDYQGTSVIAGAKVVQALSHMTEYRWCFGLDDLILAVGYAGPVVLGLNWYQGMYNPNDKGFLTPTGRFQGGHAILCNGVNIKQERLTLHNSWGKDWGNKGEAYISFDDMRRLLKEDGEACVPVGRK